MAAAMRDKVPRDSCSRSAKPSAARRSRKRFWLCLEACDGSGFGTVNASASAISSMFWRAKSVISSGAMNMRAKRRVERDDGVIAPATSRLRQNPQGIFLPEPIVSYAAPPKLSSLNWASSGCCWSVRLSSPRGPPDHLGMDLVPPIRARPHQCVASDPFFARIEQRWLPFVLAGVGVTAASAPRPSLCGRLLASAGRGWEVGRLTIEFGGPSR
jgi:hypothetical protein